MSRAARLRLCTSYRRSRPLRVLGFTLMEILIATSLLSVVAVILYGSFSTVLNSTERVRDEQTQLRLANFLVAHFDENISGAYLPFAGSTVGSSGFVGEDEEIDGRPVDILTFYTTATRMGGGALPGDTKRVEYSLREGEDGLYMFTVYERPRLLLPMFGDNEDIESTAASWSVPMASLDFKYYDGAEWLDSWNSANMGRLPCGVRIEAHFVEEELKWLMDEAGVEEPVLIMVVNIPLGSANRAGGE